MSDRTYNVYWILLCNLDGNNQDEKKKYVKHLRGNYVSI